MSTAFRDFSHEELAIVGECLRAAVEGPFFPEWEFQTLVGIPRESVRLLAAKWQSSDPRDEDTDAVVNVLNNLLGYPHRKEAAWSSFISVHPSVVSTLLDKILASGHE